MSTLDNNQPKITLSSVCLVLLTAFAALFVARELRAILIPFLIALFLSLLFQPGIAKANRWGVPKLVAILFYLAITVLVLTFIGRLLFNSLKLFALSFNGFIPRMTTIINEVYDIFDLPSATREEFSVGTLFNQYIGTISTALLNFTNSSINFASQAFLVLLFTVFLLLEFRNFSYKFSTAFSSNVGERLRVVGPHIAVQISHYLIVETFVSIITGIAIFIALSIIGVNFAVLWAILGCVLNFIPIVGSAFVVFCVILMSIIQFYPDPVAIFSTIISMLAIQTLFGQVLDPRLQGKSLDLSPFLILLSLSIWGWIWGIPGMFISIPLTVSLKIIMANFGPFKPIAVLMSVGTPPKNFQGDDERHKIDWKHLFNGLKKKSTHPIEEDSNEEK